MKRNFIVAAALILSACQPLPHGLGYEPTPGKPQIKPLPRAYIDCEYQWVSDNAGMGEWMYTPRGKRLKIDECMTALGYTDVGLNSDQYRY